MSKYIDNLKTEYNKLLKREKNAEKFLNEVATDEEAEKWTPLFIKITQGLSKLMIDFKKSAGREMTDSEVLNGFKDVRV